MTVGKLKAMAGRSWWPLHLGIAQEILALTQGQAGRHVPGDPLWGQNPSVLSSPGNSFPTFPAWTAPFFGRALHFMGPRPSTPGPRQGSGAVQRPCHQTSLPHPPPDPLGMLLQSEGTCQSVPCGGLAAQRDTGRSAQSPEHSSAAGGSHGGSHVLGPKAGSPRSRHRQVAPPKALSLACGRPSSPCVLPCSPSVRVCPDLLTGTPALLEWGPS